MSRYDEFFNEMMKDPEVKREFDALEPEFHRKSLLKGRVFSSRTSAALRMGTEIPHLRH